MRRDKSGFLYPYVDASLCTECGACERVCPFISATDHLARPVKAYAAGAVSPDIYRTSSSGGAAYEIARFILSQGGVVYGCAASGLDIKHIRVDSIDRLHLLQGSKYVQSNISGCLRSVRSDLAAGLRVAFFGTPCQVAAVRKFIRKPNPRLLLVDIICHGTPSLQMLEQHAKTVAPGKRIDKISFRRGNDYILLLCSGDKEVWNANVWHEPFRDMYLRAFVDGLSFRPSCYSCPYAGPERVSDITVGDFWGLKSAKKITDTCRNGISVIMPVTSRGSEIVSQLTQTMHIQECPVQEAIDGNTQLRHPVPDTRRSKLFRALYPALPFDLAVRISELDKLTIRLLVKIKKSLNGLHR